MIWGVRRMADFFISYTGADEGWAEWIAWTLEEARFSVVLQKWDFPAGSNFVLEMQRAASSAKRTIAVLSPAYLKESKFGSAEWAAAFATDPDAIRRVLVPVRVRPCEITGILKSIVYVDFVGADEATARKRLLDHVQGTRLKPAQRPAFPGTASGTEAKPSFPADIAAGKTSRPRHMPRVAGKITDQDRRRFVRDAFGLIRAYFQSALEELRNDSPSVDFEFTPVDANSLTAEIFVNGNSRSQCRIWLGGLSGGNDIGYYEGRWDRGSNALNESLGLAEEEGELFLSAMMGAMFGNYGEGLDPKKMTPEDGAEYLWRRFVQPLER